MQQQLVVVVVDKYLYCTACGVHEALQRRTASYTALHSATLQQAAQTAAVTDLCTNFASTTVKSFQQQQCENSTGSVLASEQHSFTVAMAVATQTVHTSCSRTTVMLCASMYVQEWSVGQFRTCPSYSLYSSNTACLHCS
jgi:hypothetical protein